MSTSVVPSSLCAVEHPRELLFCRLPSGHSGAHEGSVSEWLTLVWP